MQDPSYFRAQAAFCLKLAGQVSDPQAAENLRAVAADHFSKAMELETAAKMNGDAAPAPVQNPAPFGKA